MWAALPYIRAMSRTMTKAEADTIARGLFPGANYLVRLRGRMVQAGFSPQDPIFKLVEKAQEAMQDLCMAVHYETCENGVGRAPNSKDESSNRPQSS